jgi:kynureninase
VEIHRARRIDHIRLGAHGQARMKRFYQAALRAWASGAPSAWATGLSRKAVMAVP